MGTKIPFAFAAVLLAFSGVALAEDPADYVSLQPAKITLPSLTKATTTQFLASDRKGRIFLLRGDTLEVLRVRPGTSPDSLGRLACTREPEWKIDSGAYAAAMDPAGSTWVVADTPFKGPVVCDFEKQSRPTKFQGYVSTLAYSSSPIAAIIPLGNGGMNVTGEVPPMPRLLQLEKDHWEPVSWAPPSGIDMRTARNYTSQVKALSDAHACVDRKGKTWLAAWNLYRIQQVSSFTEPDREVVVGSGKVEWAGWTAAEKAEIDADLRKQGIDPATNQVRSKPVSVLRAVVCAPDGYIYVVVSKGEKLALDRFDPATDALERVLLEGVEVSGGPMAAALGSDGLILGGRMTDGSLWRISPDDLAAARWKPVLGARIDGRQTP